MDYRKEALDRAWAAIEQKKGVIQEELGLGSLQLERVSYDQDSFISQIDELPEEAKSPNPDQIQVRVEVEAEYRILK